MLFLVYRAEIEKEKRKEKKEANKSKKYLLQKKLTSQPQKHIKL